MDVSGTLLENETSFFVDVDRFQGPLDLLLHLIREQDIDVFDIPIAQITAQFLRAIRDVEHLGLDVAGEFLEMAATLVRIKAQMLLPRRVDETGEQEDPRAELVKRLLEYEHFREVAIRLEVWEMERVRRFPRGYVPPRPKPQVVYGPLETTWEEVQAGAYAVGERYRPPTDHMVAHRAVPLEEKVALIVHTLARVARIEFSRLVTPFADKLHGVITFVAGLELAKRHQLELRQSEPFAPLWLYRRKEEEKEEATDETDTDR